MTLVDPLEGEDDSPLMRRRMDDRLTAQFDKNDDRVREVTLRLGHIEQNVTGLSADMEGLQNKQESMGGSMEDMARHMGVLALRFDHHAEMEESQWMIVNKTNEHLTQLNTSLMVHMAESHVRIGALEKLVYASIGFVVALLGTVGTWVITHPSILT